MNDVQCPGQDSRFMEPTDVTEVACPGCGASVEFWPDELVRKCPGCGRRTANPEASMGCLQWCKHADRCLQEVWGPSGSQYLREELIQRLEAQAGASEHLLDHTRRVLELAERIGRSIGANPAVLVPAAILHDVGRAVEEHEGAGDHENEGARRSEEILADEGMPPVACRKVAELVEHHHDRDHMGRTPSGAALFDADLIVNLGENRPQGWEQKLSREALTGVGRTLGRKCLSDGLQPAPAEREDA